MERHSHRVHDTKDRIMDAAERLFALHGVEGTSLRAITRAADVNLAAVNYHFGSKEGLLHAALCRRLQPINRERLRLLSEYEAAVAAGAPPALEPILAAFLRPVFELQRATRDPVFLRLVGQVYSEATPTLRELFLQEIAEVLRRYQEAFARVYPQISLHEVQWCFFFTVGIMCQCLLSGDSLREFTRGQCDVTDDEALLSRLITFAAAGFRAGCAAAAAATTPMRELPHG